VWLQLGLTISAKHINCSVPVAAAAGCLQVAELPREDVVRLLRTELLADLDLGQHQCQQLLDAIGLDGCASLTIGQIRQALLKFMASSYSSDHEFDQDYDYPDMEARPCKGKQVAFAGLGSAGADSRDREAEEAGADAVVEVLPAGTAGGTMAQRTQSATSIYSQGAAIQIATLSCWSHWLCISMHLAPLP
jgi:hypothetical protein